MTQNGFMPVFRSGYLCFALLFILVEACVASAFEPELQNKSEQLIVQIMKTIGLPVRVLIRVSNETPNAEAALDKDGERYVFVNPNFIRNFNSASEDYWISVYILAHEIGHHLGFHTLNSGRDHEFELEADYFAGFVLAKMGASIDQSLTPLRKLANETATSTHPARNARLEMTASAWWRAKTGSEPSAEDTKRLLTPDAAVARGMTSKRVALVVGNGEYNHLDKLENAVRDAEGVKNALRDLDFEVLHHNNLDLKGLKRALREYNERLSQLGSEVEGLLFFAGHGVQLGGLNYLLPIDAEIKSAADVSIEAIDADSILKGIARARNKLNIIILDACRNNPFRGLFRSIDVAGGLARMDAPPG